MTESELDRARKVVLIVKWGDFGGDGICMRGGCGTASRASFALLFFVRGPPGHPSLPRARHDFMVADCHCHYPHCCHDH